MIALSNIEAPCGHNQGGIHSLRIIPAYNVRSIPPAVRHVVQEAINLWQPGHYADVYFTRGGYSEPMVQDAAGEYFKQTLDIYVPKDTPEVAYLVSQLTGVPVILIYTDGNGYTKLVGSIQAPLLLSSDLNTGDESQDKNGHKLTFRAESVHKAYFYSAQDGIPPPQKMYSKGFSLGFLQL